MHGDEDALSRPPASRRSGLPLYATELIGRATELAALDRMILEERRRLVTIRGPGGMGKTRLATAWAERARRTQAEVVYCALVSIASAEHVPSAVAVAIGLTVRADSDPGDEVMRSLERRETVLVLDNLEHLVADPLVTRWLQRLIDRCPRVRVVVTSRERLGLTAEHLLELGGLAVPTSVEETSDAVALFEHRARQVLATFELAAHREAVVEICRLLEGMPLGIELAATWVRLLQCTEILAEIRRTLDFLTADARSGRDPRQSSMRAVFSQSWALLSPAEQRVLARLSVFRGGFDRGAAERIAGATLPVLASLLDRSLVRVREAGAATRYDMHELLRQFAAEQLAEVGAEPVGLAHAEYFTERAQAVHPQLRGQGQVAALADLTSDVDNLRATLQFSLDHGRPDLAARVGWALWPFWWIRNMQREGRRWMEQVMEHKDALDVFWRTQATISMGAMVYAQGDVQACVRYAKDLEELAARAGGEPRALAFAHGGYGLGATASGDLKVAAEHLAKARALFQQAGDPGIAAQAATWMGTVQLLSGDLERARASASSALDEALAAGDRLASVSARYCLARIALGAGDLAGATEHLLASIPPSLAIEDRGSLSYVFELLGVVCGTSGNHRTAATMFGASDAILEAIGSRGHTYYLADTKGIAKVRAAVGEALGAAAFEAARAEGRIASIDTLVSLVQESQLEPAPKASAPPAAKPADAERPLPIRFFEEDDSVFVENDYLIKGVSGRILWRMLELREREGRDEFTNRELRLDPALKLPSFKDNLEARLVLLLKRLDEKKLPLRLERVGRGRLRLVVDVPLELSKTPAKT